jgi:hypothetical protein
MHRGLAVHLMDRLQAGAHYAPAQVENIRRIFDKTILFLSLSSTRSVGSLRSLQNVLDLLLLPLILSLLDCLPARLSLLINIY